MNISVAFWKAMPLMMVAHILGPRPLYKPKKPSLFFIYPTVQAKKQLDLVSNKLESHASQTITYCIGRRMVNQVLVFQKM